MSLAAFAVAACATPALYPPPSAVPFVDAPFAIEGRLSARRGSEALAANFVWRHAPPLDDLVLSTPLGQTLAEISADTSVPRYELRTSDGRREEANDWLALTERALGVPVPVAGLAAWLAGAPHANAPHTIEPDGLGRASVVRQDGWEIVYAYSDADARHPARLQLSRFDVDVRIVVTGRRTP